jgi:hypothetical protein
MTPVEKMEERNKLMRIRKSHLTKIDTLHKTRNEKQTLLHSLYQEADTVKKEIRRTDAEQQIEYEKVKALDRQLLALDKS